MERKRRWFCFFMVLPAILFTVVLGLIPMFTSLGWSFLEYDLMRVQEHGTPFVGLENYRTVLNDGRFLRSISNTFVMTGLVVVVAIALGLVLAHVMKAEYRGRAIVRVLICAPWFVPPVVAAAIWAWLLNADRSPINSALMDAGIIESNIRFLTDSSTWGPFSIPLLSVTAVRIWNGLPFIVIFILAGMQSIPRDLYEAVDVDGGNLWSKFRHVTLPLLRPILGVLIMLLLITGIGHFEINYIMTGGGPQDMTNVMAVYSYLQAFNFFRFDLASAAGGLILLITAAICFFYIRTQLRNEDR
ncbi:carbohydrate ABC transporter permease [Amaricoccus tamworthensis]|uniref:carbohydrate ABC transporter permease n=1 Tax=Amaricoccus tamworthensis TaxID=57002 RepID=UPI003C7C98E6